MLPSCRAPRGRWPLPSSGLHPAPTARPPRCREPPRRRGLCAHAGAAPGKGVGFGSAPGRIHTDSLSFLPGTSVCVCPSLAVAGRCCGESTAPARCEPHLGTSRRPGSPSSPQAAAPGGTWQGSRGPGQPSLMATPAPGPLCPCHGAIGSKNLSKRHRGVTASVCDRTAAAAGPSPAACCTHGSPEPILPSHQGCSGLTQA